MDLLQTFAISNWTEKFSGELQAHATNTVENGKLIFFPQLEFALQAKEKLLLSPAYANPKSKNISFDYQTSKLRGALGSNSEQESLKELLQRFSVQAKLLVHALFPCYINALQQGRTSFRPVEIKDRESSYRKDDTRLHVDAFPATPNQGRRILRVFSNINPHGQDRVWRVGEPFEKVATHFLPKIRRQLPGSGSLLKALRITKSKRAKYDHYMLKLHDHMKADLHYQKNAQQSEIRFPPASSWIVMTDHVSHAAMFGQHALEQTFYLPVAAMQNELLSPLRVLERLTGSRCLV